MNEEISELSYKFQAVVISVNLPYPPRLLCPLENLHLDVPDIVVQSTLAIYVSNLMENHVCIARVYGGPHRLELQLDGCDGRVSIDYCAWKYSHTLLLCKVTGRYG
jgi:hypothetical protein